MSFLVEKTKMLSDFMYERLLTSGDRIKAVRTHLGLTRKQFAEKHGFSDSTLKAIEYSTAPLKPSQLHKLIEIFLREGLPCSEEWIITGKGEPLLKKEDLDKTSSSLLNPISEEIKVFQKNYPRSLLIQLKDNSMSPFYEKQDYIGGIKITRTLKPSDYGRPYIVVLQDNKKLVRSLYPGQPKELFTLISLNLLNPLECPCYVNVPLNGLYEIIWYRKGTNQPLEHS
jgi:transcriptional regulator with XRE-family HTH domain